MAAVLTLDYLAERIEKITAIAEEVHTLATDALAQAKKDDLEDIAHIANLFQEAASLQSLAGEMTATYLVTKRDGEAKFHQGGSDTPSS